MSLGKVAVACGEKVMSDVDVRGKHAMLSDYFSKGPRVVLNFVGLANDTRLLHVHVHPAVVYKWPAFQRPPAVSFSFDLVADMELGLLADTIRSDNEFLAAFAEGYKEDFVQQEDVVFLVHLGRAGKQIRSQKGQTIKDLWPQTNGLEDFHIGVQIIQAGTD
eukprot:TRINITY_DN29237_c0_g1_i2.p1 TRINITY_DN29237_c0_g1~~TRINITY_DN29237_c0_g1_i2.p1  ORF type:complete len:162 (+),score=34.43 TRINITY_DN29237_c0_g1_i2:192-677(+)